MSKSDSRFQAFFTDFGYRIRYGRKFKDNLFCELFGQNKQALLELYNALNGSDYKDPNMIEVVTIQNAIYITTKNDVAYLMNGTINLYEHQSTNNPNMPVRFLVYLAQEYQKYIEKAQSSVYGTKLLSLPTPKCVVFYNGTEEKPERYMLKLSDAFLNREVEADAELTVHVYNVNAGHNTELMEKCATLYGYSVLINKVERYRSSMSLKAAIERAIRECMEEDILKEFLSKYRAEVLGMLLFDFDKKKYERSLREEGYEDGVAFGREKGIEEGISHSVRILADDYMRQNPALSFEDAYQRAETLLRKENVRF